MIVAGGLIVSREPLRNELKRASGVPYRSTIVTDLGNVISVESYRGSSIHWILRVMNSPPIHVTCKGDLLSGGAGFTPCYLANRVLLCVAPDHGDVFYTLIHHNRIRYVKDRAFRYYIFRGV